MRFKTDMEALVLGALADGPLHGYGIVKKIRDQSNGLFGLPESQLYPLLHQMQARGWIQGEWEMSASGPARKCYTLLAPGRAELGARRQHFEQFTAAVGNLLIAKERSLG